MELLPPLDDVQRVERARKRLVEAWSDAPEFAGSGKHPREFVISAPTELVGRANMRYDRFTLGPVATAHVTAWTRQADHHGFRFDLSARTMIISVPYSYYAHASLMPWWFTRSCFGDVASRALVSAMLLAVAYVIGGSPLRVLWRP